MRIETFYSHLNGYEWLLVHRPKLWREIELSIKAVDAKSCRTKKSKEKTMLGQMLYSPIDMNEQFKQQLTKRKWEYRRVDYWVTRDADMIRQTLAFSKDQQKQVIEAAGHEAIHSYNQTDFTKDRIAVEVQFGKYSFIAYDMFVKHLAFYVGNSIDCGIEILPMKSLQSEMSSGPGYFESALYDLIRQGRGVPAVPMVLVGVAP